MIVQRSEQANTRATIERNKIHAITIAIGVHYILITFANEHANTRAIIEHKNSRANTRAIGVHYTLIAFANTRATIAHKIVHRRTPEQSERKMFKLHSHTKTVRVYECTHHSNQRV